MKNDFLRKEVHRLVGTKRAGDLFKATPTDDGCGFESVQAEMASNAIQTKLQMKHCNLILQRLRMVARLRLAHGPRFILCCLERIRLEKRLFGLALEMGAEVLIPRCLSMALLPQSCRYYDPLIKISQK
jgi:hypothetical protein